MGYEKFIGEDDGSKPGLPVVPGMQIPTVDATKDYRTGTGIVDMGRGVDLGAIDGLRATRARLANYLKR